MTKSSKNDTLIITFNCFSLSIPDNIKQFFVSNSLKVIRALIRIKPLVIGASKAALNPLRRVKRIFVTWLLVPLARLIFQIKRQLSRAYRPAKNKLMLVVTNRYTIHVIAAVLVLIVGFSNLQTNEVRAETFGERSLMYKIASNTDYEIIEEYAVDETELELTTVSYREATGLTSVTSSTDSSRYEGPIISLAGGGAISAPTISEGADSVAPRESVEEYVVQPGDTLSTIATQFGISLNTLLWANSLTVRSVLQPGDSLTILPVTGVYHTVAKGDTISKVAAKYQATADEIIEFNKLASANDLVVGEKLVVPGGVVPAPVPVPRSTAIGRVFTSPIGVTTSTAAPTTVGSGSMVWPSDLRAITQYYGWRHTGLDVDCYFTNDNYAADYGVVQYAGWKGGYGNLIEINHGNGIVTRYGHHALLYVKAGDQVSRGQAIGRCGTTGRSTGTHLHFEVIVNGSYRNPLEYIR